MLSKIKSWYHTVRVGKYFLADILSPERWKMVWISKVMKHLIWLEGTASETELYDEPHIIEQYMWRFLMCSDCVANGDCLNCKCPTLAKMKVRSDYCKLGKWGPFMPKLEWEAFKLKIGLKFIASVGNHVVNLQDETN